MSSNALFKSASLSGCGSALSRLPFITEVLSHAYVLGCEAEFQSLVLYLTSACSVALAEQADLEIGEVSVLLAEVEVYWTGDESCCTGRHL